MGTDTILTGKIHRSSIGGFVRGENYNFGIPIPAGQLYVNGTDGTLGSFQVFDLQRLMRSVAIYSNGKHLAHKGNGRTIKPKTEFDNIPIINGAAKISCKNHAAQDIRNTVGRHD